MWKCMYLFGISVSSISIMRGLAAQSLCCTYAECQSLLFSYKPSLSWGYYLGMSSSVRALRCSFFLRSRIRTRSTAFSRKLGCLSWQCRLWTENKAIFWTLVLLSTNLYSNSFKIMRYQFFLNFYLSAIVTEITLVALLMICINQSEKEIRSLKYLEVERNFIVLSTLIANLLIEVVQCPNF